MNVWQRAMTLAWRLHALHEAVDRVRIYGPSTVDESDLSRRLDVIERGVIEAERSGIMSVDLPHEQSVHQAVMALLQAHPGGLAIKEINRVLVPHYGAPAVAMVLLPLILAGRVHEHKGIVQLGLHRDLEEEEIS